MCEFEYVGVGKFDYDCSQSCCYTAPTSREVCSVCVSIIGRMSQHSKSSKGRCLILFLTLDTSVFFLLQQTLRYNTTVLLGVYAVSRQVVDEY